MGKCDSPTKTPNQILANGSVWRLPAFLPPVTGSRGKTHSLVPSPRPARPLVSRHATASRTEATRLRRRAWLGGGQGEPGGAPAGRKWRKWMVSGQWDGFWSDRQMFGKYLACLVWCDESGLELQCFTSASFASNEGLWRSMLSNKGLSTLSGCGFPDRIRLVGCSWLVQIVRSRSSHSEHELNCSHI